MLIGWSRSCSSNLSVFMCHVLECHGHQKGSVLHFMEEFAQTTC